MAQTEEKYCYEAVYNQDYALYGFNQRNSTNEQYYERFNTKVNVGEYISITRQNHVLMKYTSQETKSLMAKVLIKLEVRKDT